MTAHIQDLVSPWFGPLAWGVQELASIPCSSHQGTSAKLWAAPLSSVNWLRSAEPPQGTGAWHEGTDLLEWFNGAFGLMPEAALVHPHSEGVCSACAPALSRHKDTTPCWPFASSASSLRRLSIAGPELSFPHATSESQHLSRAYLLAQNVGSSCPAAKGAIPACFTSAPGCQREVSPLLRTFATEGGSFKTRPCTKRQRARPEAAQ